MPITIAEFHNMYLHAGPDDCWIWHGTVWGQYGGVHIDRVWHGAHVIAWMLVNGRYPLDGMEVMHSCNNKLCMNPQHLSEGTHQQNMQQMVDGGLQNIARGGMHYQSKKTHCPIGHPYEGNNLTIRGGKRVCRECQNEASRLAGEMRRQGVPKIGNGGAQNIIKTHCPQGHPYSGTNLKITTCGRRQCRRCVQEAGRRYEARKRGL